MSLDRLRAKKIVWAVLLVFFGVTLFFSAAKTTHAAFGISPPFLNADHLVPGTKYVQTIYLVQDQPNTDVSIQANLQMDQPGASWVSIDKGFNFVIPQGTRQFPVEITINVPQNAGLGIYHGTLTFTTVPSSAGQVTIALGAQVAINLTVGTGTFEKYSIPSITFPDINEGQSPVVDVKFENDGNVPEGLDGATYALYDQYDAVQLAYVQKSDGFPTTPAFTISDYKIQFPLDFYLGIGQYWGIVTFYKGGQVVASDKLTFNVLKATWYGKMESYLADEWPYALAVLLLLVLVIIVAVWRTRRRSA